MYMVKAISNVISIYSTLFKSKTMLSNQYVLKWISIRLDVHIVGSCGSEGTLSSLAYEV